MVERIEKLDADLQVPVIARQEILQQRRVYVHRSGTDNDAVPSLPHWPDRKCNSEVEFAVGLGME